MAEPAPQRARRRDRYRAAQGESVSVRLEGEAEVLDALEQVPRGIATAEKRALRKLATWSKRQILRQISAATDVPQRVFGVLGRYNARIGADGALTVWIGTNPIAAQEFGTVLWTRRMIGARAGRQQFPGAWSWVGKPGAKTGKAIMRRTGRARDRIVEVKADIHPDASAVLQRLAGPIGQRFNELLRQELNYLLRVQAGAA